MKKMDKVKQIISMYGSGIQLVALLVKAVTGVFGASLILEQNHPYLALTILSLGALANEILVYLEKNKK